MSAGLVVGQPDFTSRQTTVTQSVTPRASGLAISATGKLAVVEQSTHRVLIWNTLPTVNGQPADVVVGQADFISTAAGVTASSFASPAAVTFSSDGSKLLVADAPNNRVMIWNTVPTSNGQPADVVIGQTNFTSNGGAVTQTGLRNPAGLTVTPGGKLLIADSSNNRILIFNSIPTANGAAADIVIGQTDFVSNSSGVAANKLFSPYQIAVSSTGKLVVADYENSRVVIFNTVPTSNGASADVAVGQVDLATGTTPATPTQTNLGFPWGVAISPSGQLAIADYSWNRVMIYNSIPTVSGAPADAVLGQVDFVHNTADAPTGTANAQGMRIADQLAFSADGRLWVPGRDMSRVMVFGTPLPPPVARWDFEEGSGSTAFDTGALPANDGVMTSVSYSIDHAVGSLAGSFSPGSSSKVVVADEASLNPTAGLSITAWFKAASWPANNRIIQKGGFSDDQYRITAEGGVFRCDLDTSGFGRVKVDLPLPSTGVWHHVAMVYDPATGLRVYLDGALAGSNLGAFGSVNVTTSALNVGMKPSGVASSDTFNGLLDDVRLYNLPLTAAEVGVVWGGVLTVQPPAPVASTFGDVVTGAGAPNASGADSGAKFDALQRGGYLAQNGNLVFPGNLLVGTGGVTNANFMGYWKHDGTSLKLLARQGDNAPETGGTAAKFNILPQVPGINDDGQVTLMASLLQSGASTPPTTADNDLGVWSELGGTGFQILMRENDAIPGLGGPLVDSLGYGCFATARTAATTGEAAFVVGMKGSSTDTALLRCSVVSSNTTAVGVVAREGVAAPGAGENYGGLNNSLTRSVRMDATGNVVFAAALQATSRTGIWYQPKSTGVVAKTVLTGETAPGTTATFQSLDLPNMGGGGTFAFRGVLNTVGDNSANAKNDGIWKSVAGAAPTLVLRRGDGNTERPGLFTGAILAANPGIKAGNIYNGWLTNANHGAWLGWVDLGGNGISPFPYNGVFDANTDTFGVYTDTSGTTTLLTASGQSAPGIAGASFFFIDHPVCGGVEQVAFIATVTGGGVTAGTNDKGIWRTAANGGALSLVLRTGDTMSVNVNGTPTTKTVSDVDLPGSGYVDHIWETPVMDGTGRLIVFVTFTDGSTTEVLAP